MEQAVVDKETGSSLELWELRPPSGAVKDPKRRGRGEASGLGKTAGKGHKGLKARSGGKVRAGFEGGQMPLYRRVSKIGFVSRKRVRGENRYKVVSISDLNRLYSDGETVDVSSLAARGIVPSSKEKAGIKILASGEPLKVKLTLRVQKVTNGAKKAIEEAGGSIELVPFP